MKRTLTHIVFFAAVIALVSACASLGSRGGQHPVENVTSSMSQVHSDLQDAIVQVDVVDASIDSLLTPNEEPLPSAFDRYSDHVTEMEKVGAQLEKHADAMRSKGTNYFSEWQTNEDSVTNAQVRDISATRQAEQRETFSEISKNSSEVKRALQTYISDLRDIETYLSNDLTPAGVKAIAPVAKQARQDGEALQQAIKPMMSAIDRAKSGMDVSTLD